MDTNKNKAKQIDARPFGEIYTEMGVLQKRELFRQFHLKNICSTRQSLWNWATGKATPAPIVAEAVAKVLGNFIGKSVYVRTLFPNSQRNDN